MKKILTIAGIGIIIAISTFVFVSRNKETSMTAENTLLTFFDHVSRNQFEKASRLLEPENSGTLWEELKNFSLPEQREDKATVLKNYCEAVGTCLPAEILKTAKESDNIYMFTVQFRKPDKTIFILGPCCGATEEEMPSKTEFDFTVKKIDSTFRITTPPVYVP